MPKNPLTLPHRLWFRAVWFAVLYTLAVWVSKAISFPLASFATLWLPSGVLVGVLLLTGMRRWPVFLLVAMPINLLTDLASGQSFTNSLLFMLSSALEAVVATWALRRFSQDLQKFNTPEHVLHLIIYGAMIASGLSATINTTLHATLVPWSDFWSTWRIAWISHALGILVITPLILAWADFRPRMLAQLSVERLIEMSILALSALVTSLYVFIGEFGLNRKSYMIVPFMVWAALRFGTRGATLLGLLVTLISAWGTTWQLASFAYSDVTIAMNMDALGSFLVMTLLTSTFLATTWSRSRRVERALRDSEERYRLVVENQGEGIGIVDTQEVFTFANPAAAQILGLQPGELVGRCLSEFTDAQQFKLIQQQTERRIQGKKTTYEVEIIQPGGQRRSLLVTATPQQDADGAYSGTFAVFHDITERKLAEMALHDSRSRFKTLFDHSPIAIWEEDFSRIKRLIDGIRKETDHDELSGLTPDWRAYFKNHQNQVKASASLLRVLDVNQATLELFCYNDKAEFMAQVNRMVRRGPNDIFIEELVAIAEGRTSFEMEGPNDLVNGVIRYHYVRWTVAPGYESDYRRVIVSIIDVTERRAADERMRYLSNHDVLTGLYNRNFFETEMERLQNSRLEPMNVMMIDVNGMKAANDTLGHAAGDELLRRTAQVLKLSFRKEDIIARIGGDEFVVLFHGAVSIPETIARVGRCLKEHNHWYEGPPLSLAIGAVSGGKEQPLVELLKKADQMMYKEKPRARKAK